MDPPTNNPADVPASQQQRQETDGDAAASGARSDATASATATSPLSSRTSSNGGHARHQSHQVTSTNSSNLTPNAAGGSNGHGHGHGRSTSIAVSSLRHAFKSTPLTCSGHTRPVVDVSFSAPIASDGSYYMISACKDGKPMLRDGMTGDWIGTFMGHKGAVWSVNMNRDATRAVTGSADFTAKYWDATTGNVLHTFRHDHIVRAALLSPATSGTNGSNDTPPSASSANTGGVAAGGGTLMTAGHEGFIRLWDLARPEADPLCFQPATQGDPKCIKKLIWDASARTVISGGDESVLRVWDTRTQACVRTLDMEAPLTSLTETWSGDRFMSTAGKTIYFWNLKTFELDRKFTTSMDVAAAALNPEETKFVVGGASDLWVHIFDFQSGHELEVHKGHHGPIHTVAFAPDGELYATGSEDGTIRMWHCYPGHNYGLWRYSNHASSETFHTMDGGLSIPGQQSISAASSMHAMGAGSRMSLDDKSHGSLGSAASTAMGDGYGGAGSTGSLGGGSPMMSPAMYGNSLSPSMATQRTGSGSGQRLGPPQRHHGHRSHHSVGSGTTLMRSVGGSGSAGSGHGLSVTPGIPNMTNGHNLQTLSPVLGNHSTSPVRETGHNPRMRHGSHGSYGGGGGGYGGGGYGGPPFQAGYPGNDNRPYQHASMAGGTAPPPGYNGGGGGGAGGHYPHPGMSPYQQHPPHHGYQPPQRSRPAAAGYGHHRHASTGAVGMQHQGSGSGSLIGSNGSMGYGGQGGGFTGPMSGHSPNMTGGPRIRGASMHSATASMGKMPPHPISIGMQGVGMSPNAIAFRPGATTMPMMQVQGGPLPTADAKASSPAANGNTAHGPTTYSR